MAQALGGLHGRGAFLHDELIAVEIGGDSSAGALNVRQVGAAVFLLRRAYAYHQHGRLADHGRAVGQRFELAGVEMLSQKFAQSRLEEGGIAVGDALRLCAVVVGAERLPAKIGEPQRGRQAHMAEADYADGQVVRVSAFSQIGVVLASMAFGVILNAKRAKTQRGDVSAPLRLGLAQGRGGAMRFRLGFTAMRRLPAR